MTVPKWPVDDRNSLPALAHLSSSVGHNLINAFSAIVSNAEILRLTDQSGQSINRSEVTELIIQASMDASTIARRLIDLTRSITRPERSAHAITSIVRQVCRDAAVRYGERTQFVLDLKELDFIECREADLYDMLATIVANAVESLPDGAGEIEVAATIDNRGRNLISIRDRGCGMDEHTLEHALDPFFSTKPGHSGIGLTIANSILRRHRGSLTIQSAPGDGTVVSLMLPPEAIMRWETVQGGVGAAPK
jgi:two-component system, NtrC family, sensor kinase